MSRIVSFVCLTAALATGALAQQPGGPIKPGKWTERNDAPDGWVIYESRHYQIQSECGRDKAERLS